MSTPSREPSRLPFALAVFLGAFLVFQVQPLIGKYVLPWYGGTPAVWTTCLLVFQTLLFAGYAWADWLARRRIALQVTAHLALLAAVALLPVVPADSWKPTGTENPLARIVLMLAATVGAPYFALAATGPLLQAWCWRVRPDRSPYALYALSNAGSLLALVSYPFVVEPYLSGGQQALVWRIAFVAFVALCAGGAWLVWRAGNLETPPSESPTPQPVPSRGRRLSWVAWSACSVILFMAVTNQLALDVASVPFLWVAPLSLYLLAFIVAFRGEGTRRPVAQLPLLVLALVALAALLELDVRYTARAGFDLPILVKVGVHFAALFVLCWVCHGELYRSRPAPRQLTSFYLAIAFGGALGGIAVGLLAPLAFLLYQELQVGMLGCAVLFLVARLRERPSRLAAALSVAGVLLLAAALANQSRTLLAGAVETRRSFFGLLRIQEVAADDPVNHAFTLFDGAIVHGYQLVRPDLRRLPTTYYTRQTGVGRVLGLRQAEGPVRIGVVGLGVGTLAAYGRAGDYLRFYEINPDVADVARTSFTFLSDTSSQWDIVLGDARLTMERDPPQAFDVLVLDAFSSDAIPVHLLTLEAFEVWERHLAPDGVIAINISNLHVELAAILYPVAEQRRFHALEVRNLHRPETLTMAAAWMFLSHDTDLMNRTMWALKPAHEAEEIRLGNRPHPRYADVRAWTDTRSSLFRILK